MNHKSSLVDVFLGGVAGSDSVNGVKERTPRSATRRWSRCRSSVAAGGGAPGNGSGARPGRILVVDDQEQSRRTLQRMLMRLGYEVELARDGIEALAKLALDIDLVLLDARMPGMDGFEVAQHIRAIPEYFDLPLMMVTGLDSQADRLRAVASGVNDFITKPIETVELQPRTRLLLQLKRAHDAIKRYGMDLEHTVEQRTAALRVALERMTAAQRQTHEAHLDTIRRLVLAAEYKDRGAAAHVERIGLYSEVLAKGINLTPGKTEIIRHATLMHDVGKIGSPDAILLKPGQLDEPEWEIMKRHTAIGARILQGSPSQLLHVGRRIALTHHERWDGSGYPNGIRGEEIPIEGRICAVADVFDALTSNRPYRDALPNKAVYDELQAESGAHFDPAIVNVFFEHIREIEEIQREYGDSTSARTASQTHAKPFTREQLLAAVDAYQVTRNCERGNS